MQVRERERVCVYVYVCVCYESFLRVCCHCSLIDSVDERERGRERKCVCL